MYKCIFIILFHMSSCLQSLLCKKCIPPLKMVKNMHASLNIIIPVQTLITYLLRLLHIYRLKIWQMCHQFPVSRAKDLVICRPVQIERPWHIYIGSIMQTHHATNVGYMTSRQSDTHLLMSIWSPWQLNILTVLSHFSKHIDSKLWKHGKK